MDQDACAGAEAEHDYAEKAKARKSGPSLLRKSEELADRANVFAAAVYWDPTHKCLRVAARLPKGETLPDLNRLVAEALAGRLPEPRAQPRKKNVPSRPRTTATGAGQRTGKTQQVQRPLRRSARMQRARGSGAIGEDVYTFRGDSECALEAEDTNDDSGGNGSGSGYSDSERRSHHDFSSVPEQSLVGSDHETSVSRHSDLGRAATQGAGAGGAADRSPPGSLETSAVVGATQAFEQTDEAMDLLNESFFGNFGADMDVTEAAAEPVPVVVVQREDASAAALPQPAYPPVLMQASPPRPGMMASDAWRRMAQNALGIVNLLLAPEPRSVQAGLSMPPSQPGRVLQGQRRSSSVYSDAFDLTELTETILREQREQQTHIITALNGRSAGSGLI
ncbi:hypothetical protein MY4038_006576 [Beauveria bassiana]